MARRNDFRQGGRHRGDRRPRRRQRTVGPHGTFPCFPCSRHRPGGSRGISSSWFRCFASDRHAAELVRTAVHNWNLAEPLTARPTRQFGNISDWRPRTTRRSVSSIALARFPQCQRSGAAIMRRHDRAGIEPVSVETRTGLLKTLCNSPRKRNSALGDWRRVPPP